MMLRREGAGVLGLAWLLALCACLTHPGGPGPPPAISTYAGQSAFELEPADPVLVPGEALTLQATFHNIDARPFEYRVGAYPCGDEALVIGAPPLEILDRLHDPTRPSIGGYTCTGWDRRMTVAPDEAVSRVIRWNGTFRLIDHAAIERGEAPYVGYLYAAPGAWPVRLGWGGAASYPTRQSRNLTIEENDLNRGSGLHADRCREGRGETASMREATVEPRPVRAPLGTPVRIYVNYTVEFDRPGCFLVRVGPSLKAEQGGTVLDFEASDDCNVVSNPLYVEARNTTVRGRLVFTWDGYAECGGGARPPEPGPVALTLNAGGFGHGFARDGRPFWVTASMEWLPPNS
jgi:hypothetical protein